MKAARAQKRSKATRLVSRAEQLARQRAGARHTKVLRALAAGAQARRKGGLGVR